MKIQIYSQNFDLTEPFRQYLQARFDNLDKYQVNVLDFQVKLKRDQRHNKGDVYTVEVKLNLADKKSIFVKEEDSDARAAGDNVQEKLARLLVKNKDKRLSKLRRNIKKFKSLKFWKKED